MDLRPIYEEERYERLCPVCITRIFYLNLAALKDDILAQTVCPDCTAKGLKHPRLGQFSKEYLQDVADHCWDDILEDCYVLSTSDEDIIDAYESCKNAAAVARSLGLSRQSVHKRLQVLNIV
jgi:transcriptional regulator of acetoin/glycerol metabolism